MYKNTETAPFYAYLRCITVYLCKKALTRNKHQRATFVLCQGLFYELLLVSASAKNA